MNIDTLTQDRVITVDFVRCQAKIFHFDDWCISSQNAVEAIKAEDPEFPWEPAKIEHLLAFGAICPEEQRKYPIVGLGSVAEVRGDLRVPCLDWNVAEHSLSLEWWGDDWFGCYRFLAVRKLPLAA